MKGKAVPSSKPKIEGILPEELYQKTEAFLQEQDISRSKLVQKAIELYIDASKIYVPLNLEDQKKLQDLAQRDCRTFELEAQYALQKFIKENEEEG